MAERKPALTVTLSFVASDELDAIWRFNAKRRGVSQADAWDSFLKQNVVWLATEYDEGEPVEKFPELRYRTCKKRRSDDGHYLIYEVDEANQRVTVLHVFHTKMDVIGRLEREFE